MASKETILENIKVSMSQEKDSDGLVTIENVNYGDLRNIFTMAWLHNSESEKKYEEELKAIDPREGMAETALLNAADNWKTCIDGRILIDALSEGIKHCINQSHNPKLPDYQYKQEKHKSDPYMMVNLAVKDKREEIRLAKTEPDLTPPETKEITFHPVNSPEPIPHNEILLVEGEYGMQALATYTSEFENPEGGYGFYRYPMVGGKYEKVGQKVKRWAVLPK